jgi:hypothetical protein
MYDEIESMAHPTIVMAHRLGMKVPTMVYGEYNHTSKINSMTHLNTSLHSTLYCYTPDIHMNFNPLGTSIR